VQIIPMKNGFSGATKDKRSFWTSFFCCKLPELLILLMPVSIEIFQK